MVKTVFTIDAGNTNIVLGALTDDGKPVFTARAKTDRNLTGDQYAVLIKNILNLYKTDPSEISGSIISTVVPELAQTLGAALRLVFGTPPLIVGKGVESGLKVKGATADVLGADLVCGAVGALGKYKPPLIIFDYGTATTISAIDRDGIFIGGSIIPGAKISLNALSSQAALLQDVDLDSATELSPIGLDTASCMRAGILLGSASMMDGMIERCREILGGDAAVIATGGLAGIIVPHCKTPGIILDRELLLYGLYRIYMKNK